MMYRHTLALALLAAILSPFSTAIAQTCNIPAPRYMAPITQKDHKYDINPYFSSVLLASIPRRHSPMSLATSLA